MKPPSQYRTVKQPPGSKICVACCVAMATGHELADVEKAMRSIKLKDGTHFYPTSEAISYLGRHGIMYGTYFHLPNGPMELVKADRLHVRYHLDGDGPAILSVESNTQKLMAHAVFWDGKVIRDPWTGVGDEVGLEGYKVREVIPLTYFDEKNNVQ